MNLFLPNSESGASSVRNERGNGGSALFTACVNMLICGPRAATDDWLRTVAPYLRSPVRRAAYDAPRELPPAGRTVILDGVETLTVEQQVTLLRWLDECLLAETQVVTVIAVALYTEVQAGRFLDGLYYRLNMITIDVSAAGVEW